MKSISGGFRAAVLMGAAASVMVFATGAGAQSLGSKDNAWPYAPTGKSPVLAVVGDVSCQPGAEGPGEAANEVCTDPATPPPYTTTSLVAIPGGHCESRLRL